jgi:molybdopterin/thiamine biosynthesis adenylyltransferase
MWSAEEARCALLPAVSEANMARLRRLIKGGTAAQEYVIVRLPRPSGGDTLFGIRYDEVGDAHPLLNCGTAARLVPLQLERLDREYLVHRGGGDAGLDAARVLLVGCGSLGGYIAFELAHAGILDLTLVDHDLFKPENTHRHVLGRRYWFVSKALALGSAIEEDMPYVRATGVASTIEEALSDGSVDLAAYDLVICALGNASVELAMNERLHTLRDGPASLFTWLEPLGIGGHALLIAKWDAGGCFECLYTSADEVETLDNRAAFAGPGQSFGRALSGCGSLHTPYGSVDAVQTAAQAVRLAVDVLTGRETGNPLVSWKGDGSAFKAAGYRLSHRYAATSEELRGQRYEYRSLDCRICGSGHRGR